MSTISVIIPAPPDSQELPVLSFLKNIDYPKDKIEIILSAGNWPSTQRNQAAQIAKGDILYFLNTDVRLEEDLFKKVTGIFSSDSRIAGVGGPDLTPSDNNYLQHLFGYAMGSYFAHWRMRARYLAIGRERISNEKELLLSNMAIRKDVYFKFNGFDERLYPNEENEIINRIIKGGYRFIYSPDVKIYRDRRKDLFAFIRQFYRYGKGRMGQIFIEGAIKNLPFFIPLSLLGYI
jgi:succinoglycan biosynthesis protein ExoA